MICQDWIDDGSWRKVIVKTPKRGAIPSTFVKNELDYSVERIEEALKIKFMEGCFAISTDFTKCDYCEFRFKCYTYRKNNPIRSKSKIIVDKGSNEKKYIS